MALHIEQRGAASFRARVRISGFPRCSRTFETEAAAREWASAAAAALKNGDLPPEPAPVPDAPAPTDCTLGALLAKYGREVTSRKRGAKREFPRLRWIQASKLAKLPVAMLKTAHVRQFRDERLATGICGATANRDLSLIQHCLKWGRAELDMPCDPGILLGLKRRESPPRERRLQPGEEEKLMVVAPPWLRGFICLAIETACRRGELAALTWADIDFDRRVATLRDTKNGDKGVKIPLSTRAIAALRSLNPKGIGKARLFRWAHADNITKGFEVACRAAGIKGLRLHDLRREAISRLFEKGWDLASVKAVSRHRSSAILRYVQGGNIDKLVQMMG